jgi:hypothetical protein
MSSEDTPKDERKTVTLDELNTMIAADEKAYLEKDKEYTKLKHELSKLKDALVQKHEEVLDAYKSLNDKRLVAMNSVIQSQSNRLKELDDGKDTSKDSTKKKQRDDNL